MARIVDERGHLDTAGGLCWGVSFCLLGYFAGNSYAKIEQTVGRGGAIAVTLMSITTVIVWRVRRHRREENQEGRVTL